MKKEVLGWIAGEMDMALAELPRPSAEAGSLDDVQLVAHVQRETSEAVTAHLSAIADGHVTMAEAEAAIVQIDEAVEALLTAKAVMKVAADRGIHRVTRATLKAVEA